MSLVKEGLWEGYLENWGRSHPVKNQEPHGPADRRAREKPPKAGKNTTVLGTAGQPAWLGYSKHGWGGPLAVRGKGKGQPYQAFERCKPRENVENKRGSSIHKIPWMSCCYVK